KLQALAPWPVKWIDPAPAIARRVTHLLGAAPADSTEGDAAIGFTAGTPTAGLAPMLVNFGFERVLDDPLAAI
ncbi:MAG: hypothetical protein ACRCUE_18895, partial [Bosea sp. (in: a-proteobacteria)]